MMHHMRARLSFAEGVALVVSGTIGAGILAIPYVVAQVGMLVGMGYLLLIGFGMMGLNLLVAELLQAQEKPMQLSGLARKYLGEVGEVVMLGLTYVLLFGALLAYIVGMGEVISALYPDVLSQKIWSLLAYACCTIAVFVGVRMIRKIEFAVMLLMLGIVCTTAIVGAPLMQVHTSGLPSFAQLFLPYGVLCFAFQGATLVPEVYAAMKREDTSLKKILFVAGILILLIYTVFTLVTLGVVGESIHEVATISLGKVLGPGMHVLGNLFALIGMGTGFLMCGLALRDSMHWDYHIPRIPATMIACVFPLILFLGGLNSFIGILSAIGGVLMSVLAMLILLMYINYVRSTGRTNGLASPYARAIMIGAMVLLMLGAGYSFVMLFV